MSSTTIIIAKNNSATTGVLINDLGIVIPKSSSITLSDLFSLAEIDASTDLYTLVNNNTLVINDGTSDLTTVKALDWITLETTSFNSSVIGSLSTIQIRRTTDFSLTTTYSDISFNTKDIENNTDTLVFSPDNINVAIKVAGFYEINYLARVQPAYSMATYLRVLKNNSIVIPGSMSYVNTYTNEIHEVSSSFIVYLNVGDTVKLQAYKSLTYNNTLIADTLFCITKLDGVKGEKGDTGEPGSGAVTIQKDDVNISAINILNFEGNVTAALDGTGKVTVTVPPSPYVPKLAQIYDSVGGLNVNNNTPVIIPFNIAQFLDSACFQLTGNKLYILKKGIYRVSYNIGSDNTSGSRSTLWSRCRKNGTTEIIPSSSYSMSYNSTDSNQSNVATFLTQLNAGDYLEIIVSRVGSSGTTNSIANQSWILAELMQELS